MAEKTINSRIQLKTDTSLNWRIQSDFIPKKGEFIFYSDLQRFKIGDGSTRVSWLDFVNTVTEYFTKPWSGGNAMLTSGTLSMAEYEKYTGADALILDLLDGDQSAINEITLYKTYYDSDPDGTGNDYYNFEATYNNSLYRIRLYYSSSNSSYSWQYSVSSSSSTMTSKALYMRGADNKQDYLTLKSGTNYYVQIQDLVTKASGWGWFINGAFAFTNWISGQALFITVTNAVDWDIVNFKVTNSSKNYMISCWPIGNYSETCVLADTQILTLDTATDTLVTKPVQDVKYGDTLAYWSPMKAGLVYNKVVMPPVVGDCTNYNRVYFSDGSTVDVFGTQFFWDCDKDSLIDYQKMTPSNRVCKSDGDIINFDHYESLVAPEPIKHYTLMTDKGRYVANGIQTGDKVELFYPRLMREENRKYWDALPEKTKEFFKKKHVEGMERRNWKYSKLYHDTIGAYNDEKNQLNEVIEAKQAYLDSTDYQVVKKMEGLLTDDEFAPVKVARQEARDAINAARARIAELDTTIKEKEAEVKATIYGKRKYTYHNAFEGKTRAVLDDEEPSAD